MTGDGAAWLTASLAAGGVAAWVLDPATGRIDWHPAARDVLGAGTVARAGTVDGLLDDVHPADRGRLRAALDEVRSDAGSIVIEIRMVVDGVERPLAIDGRAVASASPPGLIAGIARVLGERRPDDPAPREPLERFRAATESAPVPIWMSDETGARTYVNPAWLRHTGRGQEDETGFGWTRHVHPDDREGCLASIRQAVERREPFEAEYRLRGADGTYRWLFDQGVPRHGDDGGFAGFTGSCLDVHDRRVGEDHDRLLARIGLLLDAPLSLEERLEETVRALLPEVADASVVELIGEDGRLRRAAAAHIDARHRGMVDALPPAHPEGPIAMVARGGGARVIGDAYETVPDAALHRLIAARSAVVVPLIARGRRIGVFALFTSRAHSDRELGAADLRLAQRVADRAALAIDTARLFRAQESIAQTLQRALLPASLPELAWANLSCAYLPAGEGVEAGGDFYDAFPADTDDAWDLVVGDVCGKGPEAAALTAMARHTLRAFATAAAGPADLLRRLNAAVVRQHPGSTRFLTACVARIEPAGDGVDVRIASAGHPPPLVMRADAPVEWTVARGTLVGVFPTVELHEAHVRLEAGDRLVLYTDGITEARRGTHLLGEDGLERALTTLAAVPADDLPDALARVAADASGGVLRDDIAILVLEATGSR